MGVFLDTGLFVVLRNADDKFHSRSKELMKRALKGDFGRVFLAFATIVLLKKKPKT